MTDYSVVKKRQTNALENYQKFTPIFLILFTFLDPFALKRNVARSLNSQMVFEYIQERLRAAYKYFACPQRRSTGGRQRAKKADKRGEKLEELEREDDDDGKSQCSQKEQQGFKEEGEPESDDEDGSESSRKANEKTLDASLKEMVLNEGNKPSFSLNGLQDSDEEEEVEESSISDKDGPVTSDDLHYVFDKMIFTGGKVTITFHCLLSSIESSIC